MDRKILGVGLFIVVSVSFFLFADRVLPALPEDFEASVILFVTIVVGLLGGLSQVKKVFDLKLTNVESSDGRGGLSASQEVVGGAGQEDSRRKRNRKRMLQKVKRFWVEGVLGKSLHGIARLELELEYREEDVGYPWALAIQEIGEKEKVLPKDVKISNIFEEMSGELLILGEPGAGKTTMLLELARDLVEKAIEDIKHPIPVVLNLSSWALEHKEVDNWILDELLEKYQVPIKIGRLWLDSQEVSLLLDGLDEVKEDRRQQCMDAINQLKKKHMVDIAVCCRTVEYRELQGRLNFAGAVAIRPLSDKQVEDYLESAGGRLRAVQDVVKSDSALRGLCKSPMILSVIALAYRDAPLNRPLLVTAEEWRKKIFDTYIEKMLRHRAASQEFEPKKARDWLTKLANNLLRESQTVFYIERVQPSWLKAHSYRVAFYILTLFWVMSLICLPVIIGAAVTFDILGLGASVGLRIGLSGGVTGALIVWLGANRVFGALGGSIVGIVGGVGMIGAVYPLLSEPLWSIVGGLVFGSAVGVTFGVIGNKSIREDEEYDSSRRFDIRLVEKLGWSWGAGVRGALNALPGALLGGASIGLAISFLSSWKAGLAFGTATIMNIALGLGLARGLDRNELEEKVRPNQGVLRSAHNAVAVGLISGAIAFFVLLISSLIFVDLGEAFLIGLAFAFAGTLTGGAYVGGLTFLQHFTLRLLLAIDGGAPWRYANFLEYAVSCILLQKVGGGYIFIHRLLLEHFALHVRKASG